MIDRKKLGRPRNFDYDAALMQAMSVFWTKGYDGASLRDLTGAMGITGPSLYAAFGDKRELFLKTIDRYADVDGCEPVVAFETEDDIRKAVHGFLMEIIHYATEHESGAKGLFSGIQRFHQYRSGRWRRRAGSEGHRRYGETLGRTVRQGNQERYITTRLSFH